MEIYQLLYLKAIVDCRSYSRAASSLFVTQPTLSTAIKKLETELDLPLLRRENREIRLTEAGEQIYPYCLRILEGHDEILRIAHSYRNEEPPPMRLLVPYSFHSRFILLSKTLFYELFPETSFDISAIGVLAPGSPREYLQKGNFDLMINSVRIELPANGYETCFYRNLEYFLYMPKDHPLTQHRSITPEMLRGERVINGRSRELGGLFSTYFDRFQMGDILTEEKNQLPEVYLHLVGSGLGLALMPKQDLLPENITFRPLSPPLEDSLMFVYPKNSRVNRDVIKLVRILQELNGSAPD